MFDQRALKKCAKTNAQNGHVTMSIYIYYMYIYIIYYIIYMYILYIYIILCIYSVIYIYAKRALASEQTVLCHETKRKVSVMLYTCNVLLSLSMFHLSFHVWLMLLHDSYVSRFPADRRSSQAGPCQGRTGHPQAGYAFEPASGRQACRGGGSQQPGISG